MPRSRGRSETGRVPLPPAVRRWWEGVPRVVVRETGAFLLPALLPLRAQDRLLVVGENGAAIASLLDSRCPLETAPLSVGFAGPGSELRAEPGSLPFADASLTVLVCPHQTRRWDDDTLLAFLREAWRVLTHNGVLVAWDVARSRSGRVNAVWARLLDDGGPVRLRTFAEVGRIGREAGFAWIQTLALRPFLWPPGPRLAVLMRKEHYDEQTVHLAEGETPPLA